MKTALIVAKALERWDRRDIYEREDAVAQARFEEWVAQQWWQRKADAYSKIIEALWHLVESHGGYVGYVHDGPLPEWIDKRIEHNWIQNHFDLKLSADVGAFVISRDASQALQEYVRSTPLDLIEIDDLAFAEQGYKASLVCLEVVRKEALRDLGIPEDQKGRVTRLERGK